MRRRSSRSAANIDITPLIDVLFMLIIFFVLMASFVQGKIDVQLPDGSGKSSDLNGAVTVTIKSDGAVAWDGRDVADSELTGLARSVSGRGVLVAGDKGASYGRVAKVLSILRREGVTSAGLLMQGEN